MTGIAEVIQAITPPGSGILISPPVYQPFFYRLRLAGRRVVEAPLRRLDDGRYDLDPEALDRALAADDVGAYLLCSPHNPTGRVWSREQLVTVADICQRHGAALLADEIHAPLALAGAEHVPFLSLNHQMLERTVAFTSASKAWNIPGLRKKTSPLSAIFTSTPSSGVPALSGFTPPSGWMQRIMASVMA